MERNKQNKDKWQSQKSSLTRDRIIIATLECIVEHGYESTTMAKIAKIAKVSQGSMQYHYSSKIDVIKAAIDYLHVKRLSDHIKRLEETTGLDIRAAGFPAQIVDDEPEENGYEVTI